MIQDKKMKLKDLFRTIRESRGKTQQDVADKLGVSKSAVSQWESGTTVPTLGKLHKLSEFLNYEFVDILEEINLGKEVLTHNHSLELILQQLKEIQKENRDVYNGYMIMVQENSEYRILVKRLKQEAKNISLPQKIMDLIDDLSKVSD